MENNEIGIFAVEFIFGAFFMQIFQLIIHSAIGTLDASSAAQTLSGGWQEAYENTKSFFTVSMVLLDVAGGLGFVVALNSIFNR